jgi:hypothetical protein
VCGVVVVRLFPVLNALCSTGSCVGFVNPPWKQIRFGKHGTQGPAQLYTLDRILKQNLNPTHTHTHTHTERERTLVSFFSNRHQSTPTTTYRVSFNVEAKTIMQQCTRVAVEEAIRINVGPVWIVHVIRLKLCPIQSTELRAGIGNLRDRTTPTNTQCASVC